MCFSAPKPPPAPKSNPVPQRADEQNRATVNQSIDKLRRSQGINSTIITGGMGDNSYGSSIRRTVLG